MTDEHHDDDDGGQHNGICDACGSFDLVFGAQAYDCESCGHTGRYDGE